MNQYELFVSGQYPIMKTIHAVTLEDALQRVKQEELASATHWGMYPLWEGQKRVTTSAKLDGHIHRLVIFNKAFGKAL